MHKLDSYCPDQWTVGGKNFEFLPAVAAVFEFSEEDHSDPPFWRTVWAIAMAASSTHHMKTHKASHFLLLMGHLCMEKIYIVIYNFSHTMSIVGKPVLSLVEVCMSQSIKVQIICAMCVRGAVSPVPRTFHRDLRVSVLSVMALVSAS